MALQRMALRDFVLVQALELELQPGFTVLSGETGAGKSILIDAMQIALGARADASLVREGAQRAEVVAEFDLPTQPALLAWLDEHGFEPGSSLLLRRTVDLQGKSRAWINGSAATASQLRILGEALVDIHGQHAWQSLMRPHSVRGLLDAFAGADEAPVQAAWSQWRQAQQALQQAQDNQAQWQQERERLQWQLDSIEKLAPGQGEWEQLNQQHTRLTHMQDLQQAAAQAWQALEGGEAGGEGGALPALAQALQALEQHGHIEPQFAQLQEQLQPLADQLQDAARQLRDYAQAQEWDAAELEQLDERVGQWLALARRHRQPPEDLPALWQQWQQALQALDAGIDLQALQAAEQQAREHFMSLARELSHQRQQAAPRLAQAVTDSLQELGMAGSRFGIALQALEQPQAHGLDDVQFQIASHDQGAPRALAKVASGGELSRISLAIAVQTSRLGQAGTLVFDEVDTGIGGAVAHRVGALLAQLGRDRQVLAVTHLPQVAACAHQHLQVRKQRQGASISSSVQPVQGAQRVAEIARMLGSDAPSQATLEHATEMLQAAAQAQAETPAQPAAARAGRAAHAKAEAGRATGSRRR
ncbi:DNA repair protein RecN [Vandammella animalimorsus]|uniref:DNA repair protein RecN n=1 Tax=Vandammella animalimorsus TaxID=2029117 RepID=A0A2A2APL8_9BURK|nr:DNA repair protein RecN [Vandammella animalimorsus]PAT40510.1 DNA repair protein RecN [Vandammella animalimorsus]